MKPLQRVLALLDGVEQLNGYYKALCPAHADHDPSLSVREGNDGQVLLHCHNNCTPEKVVGAIGLTMSDLFPHPRRNGKGHRRKIAEYDYHNAAGRRLYQTVRYEPKTFRQRRPKAGGGWAWNLKGVEPVLYRLPEVLEAVRSGETVYVVEGEKDADRLRELGLTATTAPMGAGKWRDSYSETLRGANVVILPDNDEAGLRHARQIAANLSERKQA
jgi:putative DNA primase/helicase